MINAVDNDKFVIKIKCNEPPGTRVLKWRLVDMTVDLPYDKIKNGRQCLCNKFKSDGTHINATYLEKYLLNLRDAVVTYENRKRRYRWKHEKKKKINLE